MKSLFVIISFFLSISAGIAQQNHFIYIQTENSQPFYVRLSGRLLSSSSSGYVVVPKLQNGLYELNIGFPKNEWPVQKIKVMIKDKDAGYVLKNFDTKGWGLFNMQTLDIIMSSGNNTSAETAKEDQPDGFADVLADIVSTPSIKQKPAAPEVKEPTAIVETKNEEAKKSIELPTAAKNSTVTLVAPRKLSTTLDNSGRSLEYIDLTEKDTVRIFIPYKQVEVKMEEQKPSEKKETATDDSKKASAESNTKFIEIEMPNSNASRDSVKKQPEKNEIVKQPEAKGAVIRMINSDCKEYASEDDFLKLRKKMAAQKTDENMIVVAKKLFLNKCYTTEQVSNLAVLFLKDEGRYNFFDAVYPRVSDSENFSQLQSKLTDEYYINRFKAMIRH